MKPSELRQRSPAELRTMIRDLRAKLQAMRFVLHQGKVKNTAAIKQQRKDIARILTVLREKTASSKQ
jgi:large subunit ribosomal protein L29